MSGEVLTINLTTDELKKLIRDEIGEAINNRPTRDDVKELVKSEVDSALSPILRALDKIESNFENRFNQSDQQLKALVDEIRHNNEAVRDVKDEQKRIDSEQDDIKRQQAEIRMELTRATMSHDELVSDIFGKEGREKAGSLIGHFDASHEVVMQQLGTLAKSFTNALQPIREDTATIREDLTTVKADVEANKQFRERRQKIEQFVAHLVPKAVKRTAGNVAWEWVLGKIPVGLALSAMVSFLIKILEYLQ